MEPKQAELELSLIKKMMDDSRKISLDNGWHFIYWGSLVTTALLLNYTLIIFHGKQEYIGWMWFIMMIGGAITGGIMEKRHEKKKKVHTIAGRIIGSLWFASGIAMFIYGFLGSISGGYNPVYICPVISTSLGISYFTSGEIQQVKLLKYVAFGWWIGAVILFFYPGIHTLLIFALMMICFQVVPGVILNRKFKKDIDAEL
jgi:hypothetical protein